MKIQGENEMASDTGAKTASLPTASTANVPVRSEQNRRPRVRPLAAIRPRSVSTDRLRSGFQRVHQGPEQVVKDDLKHLRQAWAKYQSTRARDGVYPFLQQTYETAIRWKR